MTPREADSVRAQAVFQAPNDTNLGESQSITIAAFRNFLLTNAVGFVIIGASLLVTYGYGLSSTSVSIDEDVTLVGNSLDAWWAQGRFTIAILKLISGDMLALPFVDLFASLVALLAAIAVFAFLFNVASDGRLSQTGWLVLFGILLGTMPIQAYYLTFNTYNAEVSLGYVLAGLATVFAWKWAVDRAGRRFALLAGIAALLAAGTYQSFGGVCLTGLAAAFLLRGVSRGLSARSLLYPAGLAIVPIVIAVAGAAAVALVTVWAHPGAYLGQYLGWAHADPLPLAMQLVISSWDLFTGGGYFGGNIMLPFAVAACISPVVLFVRSSRRGWAVVLMALVLIAAPFVTAFLLGSVLPARSQQALPLALAAAWLPLVIFSRRQLWLSRAAVALAVFVLSWNSLHVTQLFFTEKMAYEYDRTRADDIVQRLAAAGWDGDPLPLVIVGHAPPPRLEFFVQTQTIGLSFFDDSSRAWVFFDFLGYPLQPATGTEVAIGRNLATTMPSWPAVGAVRLAEGLVIIKLSDEQR
jgi:hypothetical protein